MMQRQGFCADKCFTTIELLGFGAIVGPDVQECSELFAASFTWRRHRTE